MTRAIGGETIVVPVRGHAADLESIFTLNEVGTTIWERLDGRTTTAALVEALCAAYDVDASVAERDVRAFLDEIEAAGLAVRAAPP